MKCVFIIDNWDNVDDPNNVIKTNFGVSPCEYFKENKNREIEEDVECPPVVGDSFNFNIFPEGINASLVGEITWRGIVKDERNGKCYYSYFVKISWISAA